MDDRAVVERQIGRRPRAFRRVAVRCPYGLPAVTEQAPYGPGGEPFPTTYYVTCRHLVAALARLEAAGGVERWSAAVREQPDLRASLERAQEEQRALRRALAGNETGLDAGASLELGIGGSQRTGSLKCLHAHAAFALARPGYELGERIVAELPGALAGRRVLLRVAGIVARVPAAAVVDLVRQEWEESHRRLQDEMRGDARREDALVAQVEAVSEQLRRRVGQWFTLAELADAYPGAEVWSRDAIAERAPAAGWERTVAIVEGAAFHLYSRGAVDYRP